MARRKKADEVVDGFTTLQAAQRAAAKGGHPQHPPAEGAQPAAKAPPPEKVTADHASGKLRVGHTAQPTRHDIVCYECGFPFFLTGQLKSTYCPKCRSILEAAEQTIDGEWNGSIKTIGLVRITTNGVVKEGARIAANCVVLEGRIEGGKVDICGRLSLCPGGLFVPQSVKVADLAIMPGALLKVDGELSIRSIEIAGEVQGRLRTTGLVMVRAGGRLAGELVGHHLVVEDGAILNATIEITPRPDAVSGKQGAPAHENWPTAESNRRSAA